MNANVQPQVAAGVPFPRQPLNESTKSAQQTTFLSPRFYTTDFEELDRTDVEPVRREWDILIDELRSDPNKRHFVRNAAGNPTEREAEIRETVGRVLSQYPPH